MWLKALRESRHMSRSWFAERVGIDKSTVFRYEKGEMDIATAPKHVLHNMAQALKVHPDCIIWLSGDCPEDLRQVCADNHEKLRELLEKWKSKTK